MVPSIILNRVAFIVIMDNDNSIQSPFRNWFPRAILRRTNWLYRVDGLRIHDIREMNTLWELTYLFRGYALQFLSWGWTLMTVVNSDSCEKSVVFLRKLIDYVVKMVELLWCEGYCYFLDFLEIMYYPATNRISGRNIGIRFQPARRKKISEIDIGEAKEMTGFSKAQLEKLLVHLRIPNEMTYSRYYSFSGEEALIHYLYWNYMAGTKLQMANNQFGGDPRRFTYSIRLISRHLYKTFYHKISGDSMRYRYSFILIY